MTIPAAIPLQTIDEQVARELERLKKHLVNADRAGADRSRRISFVYRAAESFSRRVFESSLCRAESEGAGCKTGQCCKCSPDVFAREKELLDLLPKRLDDSGFCPFFNLKKRNCGIYGVRPFACRIYYNFAPSSYYCQNPNDLTLQLFDGVRRHLEQVLGPYRGGYRP
uniref:YkgJ family cysteine cluster protein n=1 Tax=Geobacter sp. (strain M21) TaxID=443144 RepID=C6E6E2_GEOSM